jgi:glycosyltransferase involved in cell wall biosynthesis
VTGAEIFCSVIIPTIERDTLARTVESAIRQECDCRFEVIVVNDSGRPLVPAEWQSSPLVQVIYTMHRERSVARNAGAAIAGGRYYNFLDDDDWLLPGALAKFARLAEDNSAAWLYGASQLTDSDGRCLYQFDHQLSGNCFTQLMAGEWVPLQASLIKAEVFWAVGAFDNLFLSAQDKDLLIQVGLRDELAGTPEPVTGILRGVWDTSTDYSTVLWNWREASEKALSKPGAAARLRASATNAYWHGRWVRIYLLSALWSARRGQFIIMLGRLWQAAVALALAGPRLFSADCWRAMMRPHLTAGHAPPASASAQPARPRPAG